MTIRELPKIISKYRKPNTYKALIQIISSFGPFFIITILTYLIIYYTNTTWHKLFIIPLSCINAFFLVKIFIIQHDCGHQSFFSHRVANSILVIICSLFSFIPYEYRAKSHTFHHNHNGKLRPYRDIGDIMTYTVNEFKQMKKRWRLKYKLFRNPLIMFWLWPSWYILLLNRIPTITFPGRTKERRSSLINNICIMGLYSAIGMIVGWKILFMAHLPVIMMFATIAIRFFYIQHQHELTYKSWENQRDYITAAVKGSSFYDLPQFFHRMTGNIWYHHIHHLNASIPSYELARCFQEVPLLQEVAQKLTFKQSLQTLWCHLWDEKQQKMISFQDYYKTYENKKL